jgi:hypothetical protein
MSFFMTDLSSAPHLPMRMIRHRFRGKKYKKVGLVCQCDSGMVMVRYDCSTAGIKCKEGAMNVSKPSGTYYAQ